MRMFVKCLIGKALILGGCSGLAVNRTADFLTSGAEPVIENTGSPSEWLVWLELAAIILGIILRFFAGRKLGK